MAKRSRPAGGRRIGGGRIRVDAARAVGKLRDHQLADPIMWALEAVRAAMAAGATTIYADGDSDDVWIAWEGDPLEDGSVPRLFDELVSPSGDGDKRATRLLATAVNAALGLSPRWLDVYRVENDVARVVRFTSRILTTTDEGEANALRALTSSQTTLPSEAPRITRGVVVHLRRYPWLETLTLLATGQEPRELRLIREACRDLPVPIGVGRSAPVKPHAPHDVLRLRVGNDASFVALTDISGATPRPMLELAELGVVLMRAELSLHVALPGEARVPLRARLDLPKLPTNASRSAVRREDAQIKRWEQDAAAASAELVKIAAREMGPAPKRQWDALHLERLRGGCIALLAAAMKGSDMWSELASVPEMLAPLLDAPLLRDALGRPRTPRELAQAARPLVHYEDELLDPDLEPFLGDVLWAPAGDPSRALLPVRRPRAASSELALAKKWKRARDAWLERPVIQPVVADTARRLITHPIQAPGASAHACIPSSVFASVPGLEGEVSIALAGPGRSGIHVDFLVGGRRTQSRRIEAPLEGVAVLSAPALQMDMDHASVAMGPHIELIDRAVRAAAVAACEAAARRLRCAAAPPGERATFSDEVGSGDSSREAVADVALAALTRNGTELAVSLLSQLPEAERPRPLLGDRSPLVLADAWPTAGGAWLNLRELTRAAREHKVLAATTAATPGARTPHGRHVAIAQGAERELLARIAAVTAVDYGGVLGSRALEPPELARSLFQAVDHAHVEIHATHRSAFGWGARHNAITLLHMGRSLRFDAPPAESSAREPFALIVDDDRLVPTADWRALQSAPPPGTFDTSRQERALFVALADALLGRAPDTLFLRSPDAARSPQTLNAFLRSVNRLDGRSLLGRERLEALRNCAFLPVAFSDTPASAQALQDKGALPFVPADASSLHQEPVAGARVVVLCADEARGAATLFGLKARNADTVIRGLQQQGRQEARRRVHMSQRLVPLEAPPGRLHVRVEGAHVRGWLSFDPHGPQHTHVRVLADTRPLETFDDGDLPFLQGLVDVDATRVEYTKSTLTQSGRSHVQGALRAAARRLIARVAAEAPLSIASDGRTRELVSSFLRSKRHDRGRRDVRRTLSALRAARAFPSIQGPPASLDEASARGAVRHCSADLEWLAPASDEPGSLLDGPILALATAEQDPVRALVLSLAEGGQLQDSSSAVRRLLAKRRVARGLTRRPALPVVPDPRFRWKLEELMERAQGSRREAFDVLGAGELALVPKGPSTLRVFEGGVETRVLHFDLLPPIHVAAETSLVEPGRPPDARTLARIERVMDSAASQAMREAIDAAQSGLPIWLRVQLRDSALVGGTEHLNALGDVPLFTTTTGSLVSPKQLRAQAARFERVWYTPQLEVQTAPLDEARFALVLTDVHAKSLSRFVPVELATAELQLDAQARANRDRPRVSRLGPERTAAKWGISERRVERDGVQVVVMPLLPGHAARAHSWAFRDLRPLGSIDADAPWPTCAWIDAIALRPDRTWSAPAPSPVLDTARALVREHSEELVAAQYAKPIGPVAAHYVDAGTCSAAFSGRRDVQVRGMLFLTDPGQDSVVHVTHAGGTHAAAPRLRGKGKGDVRVPLSGELMVAGVDESSLPRVLGAIARHVHERMMRDLARDLRGGQARDEDLWLAQLLRALEVGCAPTLDAEEDVMVFVTRPPMLFSSIAQAVEEQQKILVVRLDELTKAEALGLDWPMLIDDGSLPSARARAAFGACAVPFREELTRRVLEQEGALDPSPAHGQGEPAASAVSQAPQVQASADSRQSAGSRARGAPSRTPTTPPREDKALLAAERQRDLSKRIGHAISASAGLGHVRTEMVPTMRHPIAALSDRGDGILVAAEHAAIRSLSDSSARREAAGILAAQGAMLLLRSQDRGRERELASIEALLAQDP